MEDIISIAAECINESEDKEVAKEKFFRKLIDGLGKIKDKELVSYLEGAYFEKSSGKTKVILSYPTKDFCPKACCRGEVDIDVIEKKLAEKLEQEMASSKGFFEEDENNITVNINDIVNKTPNELMETINEVLRQRLDENGYEKNNRDYELKMLKEENKALQCQKEELMCRLKEAQEQNEKRLEMMELKDAAEKLVDIIRHCYDPHTSIIVQCDGIKVVQDTMYIPLK